jgi:hypothetical protein
MSATPGLGVSLRIARKFGGPLTVGLSADIKTIDWSQIAMSGILGDRSLGFGPIFGLTVEKESCSV